ncbi:GAF domain-containing sensor histidine kinase [Aquipuribacter sp. SD81]|uniref:GAF domain-containing sensor histidine kinase n=1 Tax=Aquipuribacter sp. SD81 TaxID=3127703 RepID=UPI00301B40B3
MVNDELVRVVSQIAEGLDLPVVLDRLIAAARETTGAAYAAMGVLGPDGLHEEFRHVGLSAEQVARMGSLPRGHGVLGLITRERTAVVTDDISAHPVSVGFPAGHPPMTTFLGVPLRIRGTVFGNLYLTDKEGGFTDEDQQTVEALAAAASVAVDNARLYRAARQREEWAEAAGAVTSALLRGLDEEDALEAVARHAREVSGADAAVVALPGMAGEPVVEVVDGDVGGHDMVGLGLASVRALGDTLSCPLADGDGEPGVLVLVRADGSGRFGPDDVAGAEGFAAQASLSLRLAAERRRGEGRVLLDERARIARDLHDLAVQQLFAVGIELGRLKERDDLAEPVVAHVDSALDGLDTAVDHIRATLRPLRPAPRPATPSEQVARTVREASVTLGFTPSLVDTTDAAEAATWDANLVHDLLAALGEALANVSRHAAASSVHVRLSSHDGRLHLVVEDDGRGVPARPARSSGLSNMRARAVLHGGTCSVSPGQDAGTRVEWVVPLR